MVHAVTRASERRILVLDRVKRVRVGGEDPLEVTAGDRLDVALGEIREEALLPGPPNVVPRAALRLEEQPEVHSRAVEDPGERLRHPLVARIEGRIVADEPE